MNIHEAMLHVADTCTPCHMIHPETSEPIIMDFNGGIRISYDQDHDGGKRQIGSTEIYGHWVEGPPNPNEWTKFTVTVEFTVVTTSVEEADNEAEAVINIINSGDIGEVENGRLVALHGSPELSYSWRVQCKEYPYVQRTLHHPHIKTADQAQRFMKAQIGGDWVAVAIA